MQPLNLSIVPYHKPHTVINPFFQWFFTIWMKQSIEWDCLLCWKSLWLVCRYSNIRDFIPKLAAWVYARCRRPEKFCHTFHIIWFWFQNFGLPYATCTRVCVRKLDLWKLYLYLQNVHTQILFALNKRDRKQAQVCPWWRASNWRRRCRVVLLSHKWRLLFNPGLLIFFTIINLCRWDTFAPVAWRVRGCRPSY